MTPRGELEDSLGLSAVAGCDRPDRLCDLVFVHGLGGGSVSTWASDMADPATFWPHWIYQDRGEVGVWTLGYAADASRWQAESMPLADRGNTVLEQLSSVDLGARPLLFITHSMGGIVVKQILRNAESFGVARWQRIAGATRGIAFIATPHTGANIVGFAEFAKAVLRTNEQVGELRSHDSRLRELHGWFLEFHRRTGLRCRSYCEKREVRPEILGLRLPKGIMVVDETSAEPNITGERAIPLDEDHISICKPASRHTDLYRSLTAFVEECLADPPERSTGESVDGDDINSADQGIRLLQDLVAADPRIAEAVSRSKEVIENTSRQVARLQVFKNVHDALHTIELECLRPMQATPADSPSGRLVRPFKIRFAGQARVIRDCLEDRGFDPVLREEIADQLALAEAALEGAVGEPGAESYAAAVSELHLLISSLPSQVDARISAAAVELDLDRLVELMTAVSETLRSDDGGQGEKLASFVDGIEALDRLRRELRTKTSEHSRLQRLDLSLRVVCVGGTAAAALEREWQRIKRVLARLEPPFSPPLEAAAPDLEEIEREVDAAVAQGDEPSATALLNEYFRSVSTVFRDVDTELKQFCQRLSRVRERLETVLDLC